MTSGAAEKKSGVTPPSPLTPEQLVERLREVSADRASDGPSGPNYDPELLDVLDSAATAITDLTRDYEERGKDVDLMTDRWLRAQKELTDLRSDLLAARKVVDAARADSELPHWDLDMGEIIIREHLKNVLRAYDALSTPDSLSEPRKG